MSWNTNGILLSHKKNEILPFVAAYVDLGTIMLSEISQIEKDKYCKIPLTGGICKIPLTGGI